MDNSSAGVPAVIHLQTVTIQDGEQSDYVLDVEGRLVQIGETLYLRYQEMNEEEDSPATVTLKILPNGDVQLTRNGDNRSRLFFSDGKRVQAQYKTPYGLLAIDTVTPSLKLQFNDTPFGGSVSIDYFLYAGEELLSEHKIRLQFTV
nr:DUF1934 domain-containing protein [Secundilactobacillus oryzae]